MFNKNIVRQLPKSFVGWKIPQSVVVDMFPERLAKQNSIADSVGRDLSFRARSEKIHCIVR